ncbi:hypothetical protein EV356DRAFT_169743 [Viridothelium virens]|uniref:Uncharacterized protein n=1 Tax=Viridothelium virens TaxID=1048519 RepID=A0A6A6HN55_VIRVR|nr:hypothetical protein EV356DRAFT_169743 [Viridothelium virens]
MIVCDPDGFGHGGIGKGYETVEAVKCENIGPTVYGKMETMGLYMMHEYTHWKNLVAPPLGKETSDEAYRPNGVRNLTKKKAKRNADSYAWFATEDFWTAVCQTNYQDPQPSNDTDPICKFGVCRIEKRS